ncbi:MAG: hypothetical protein R3B52_00580 [Candidatus Paceibacterota bacterium]
MGETLTVTRFIDGARGIATGDRSLPVLFTFEELTRWHYTSARGAFSTGPVRDDYYFPEVGEQIEVYELSAKAALLDGTRKAIAWGKPGEFAARNASAEKGRKTLERKRLEHEAENQLRQAARAASQRKRPRGTQKGSQRHKARCRS